MLGEKSCHAAQCFQENFIGTDFGIAIDLSSHLINNQADLKEIFDPEFIKENPEKSKIAMGLARSATWTVASGIQDSDLLLCPDGQGNYHIGHTTGGYYYHPNSPLPQRRQVQWLDTIIKRSDMSKSLQNSTGSIGTCSDISSHADEIESFIQSQYVSLAITQPSQVEDIIAFQLEKYLQEFLVANWQKTELGKKYDIYSEDGEIIGQQYPADNGRIDILAISKDKKTLLVVELKRGRASDNVIGQILRYMGFVYEELAESDQQVKGAIIAFEDDARIHRALAVTPNIEFYRYEMSFKLQLITK